MNRGVGFTLTSAVLFGGTFPAVRYGLERGDLQPVPFAFYRFLLAATLLLAYAAWRKRLRADYARNPRIALLGGLVAVAYLLQYFAQELTSASKTSLLINIHVVTVAVAAHVLLQERQGPNVLAAIGLGLLGSFLVSTHGDLGILTFSNREFVGDVLAFASGLCWSVYTVSVKTFMTRHADADPVAFTFVVFAWVAVLLAPAAAFGDGLTVPANPTAWIALAYLGVLATGAVVLWQEGLRSIGATTSSVLLLVEIVVALALGAWLLAERLDAWSVVGAVAIMGAAWLAGRAPTMPSPAKAASAASPPQNT